jgi:acylphosphatase
VSTDLDARVAELLRQSLAAWGVAGEVRRDGDGAIVLAAAGGELRVTRAAPGVPFRWMMAEGARSRGVTSIVGLLRSVRAAIDAGYRPARVRFAPMPLVPS